ncbi:MAG: hypothetical protein LUG65_01765 [Clostridiales bacterium]|nr:hypothetical protein [Clostridiales bacterium]
MISYEMMADIVSEIKAQADELLAKEQRNSQDFGQLLAFAEALCIIQDICPAEELAAIGLDFDIDARYLY